VINRRTFLAYTAAGALILSVRANSQQSGKLPRVALVFGGVPIADMAGAEPTNPLARAFVHGLRDLGWIDGANVIVERRYTTAAVHQGYIEPHATVAAFGADGQCQVWSSSQGQFMVRTYCAKVLGLDTSDIRVGDTVVTSGIDGIYPKGFLIGKAVQVDRAGGSYRAIQIQPAVDFASLESVLVVLTPPTID